MRETNEAAKQFLDGRRSRLRAIMARIDRSLPPAILLSAAWNELVTVLDLGPDSAARSCLQCHAIVTLEATRCGNCWTYLGSRNP